MPRGGRRNGTPGALYPNRTDLSQGPSQPVRAVGGQPYGQRGAQEAAQRVIPLPAGPQPGAAGPLTRPTERPQEPVTSGVPIGPGAGSRAIVGGQSNDPLELLRQMYREFPSRELATLIANAQ